MVNSIARILSIVYRPRSRPLQAGHEINDYIGNPGVYEEGDKYEKEQKPNPQDSANGCTPIYASIILL